MKYYALLSSRDKIELTEDEFLMVKQRFQRSINRNVFLENGGIIKADAIVYLGVSDNKKAKKAE